MDVNTLRKIFGPGPIEFLPGAKLLEKQRNALIFGGAMLIIGGCIGAYLYYKSQEHNNEGTTN